MTDPTVTARKVVEHIHAHLLALLVAADVLTALAIGAMVAGGATLSLGLIADHGVLHAVGLTLLVVSAALTGSVAWLRGVTPRAAETAMLDVVEKAKARARAR